MYKAKIKELESAQNRIINSIKIRNNLIKYYEDCLTKDKTAESTKQTAIKTIKYLKAKLIIGKGAVLGAILGITSMIIPIFNISNIILLNVILTAGSIYHLASAKRTKEKITNITSILIKESLLEEKLAKNINIYKDKVELLEYNLLKNEQKLNEYKNAQKLYEQTKIKYNVQTNFNSAKKDQLLEK